MDDEQLQPFIAKALIAHSKPELPQKFSVVTQNPATTGSRGGLRIMLLQVPFQTARLTVRIEGNTWHVTTRNVFRIRYRAVNGVYPRPKRLVIDETTPALQIPKAIRNYNGTSAAYVDLCAVENEFSSRVSWKHCSDPTFPSAKASSVRGPDNSGPLTQVLGARRVAVIYPTGSKALLGIATRYANILYDAGISVSVTADASAASTIGEGTYNVIVLGGVGTNKAASLLQKISRDRTVRTRKGKICVGTRCTNRLGTGVAFLTPGKHRTLAVVVAGTDDDGLMAATSFLPLSPDQKVPEWVLVNANDGFGWRGYGAVEAAGYWNRNWQVEPALTYPATWAIAATRVVAVRDESISKRAVFVVVLFVVIAGIGFLLISMRKAKRKDDNEERVAFIPGELPHTNR